MSTLFVVATPIGNLEDISARALRVLREADVIAAEDTRVARALLSHFEIRHKRLVSYNEQNRRRRILELLALPDGQDVALVTDAGTPAISDPGAELVAAAREAGVSVVAVPGPSSLVAAVSVAGLRASTFYFAGFLPRTASELAPLLESLLARPEALVAFESPQRLRKTLEAIDAVAPERRLAVCRELTKLHEETFTGTAKEALAHFDQPRGEIVLVIEGAPASKGGTVDESALLAEVQQMRELGLTRTQASALLESRHGLSRRRAYGLWLASDR
jgi:16S rRNA (cytidine1402-2'-O)-methyltransferase